MSRTKILTLVDRSFQHGITSVQPHTVVYNNIKRKGDSIVIQNEKFIVKRAFIVGFGKAVGCMVMPLVSILQSAQQHCIKSGIISVPIGFNASMETKDWYAAPMSDKIDVYEGAKDNLPDENALSAARKIFKLAKDLTKEDTLFVLISGGGSALLPMPIAGLSLEEKVDITKQLSKSGATIHEMNTVRKLLSAIKGGKLALSSNARVISLIISDVIGDSLSDIASGPTTLNTDSSEQFFKILNKYDIVVDSKLVSTIENVRTPDISCFGHVHNFLIANNRTAIKAVNEYITTQKETPTQSLTLTSELQGEALLVGEMVASLGFNVLKYLERENNASNITTNCEAMGIESRKTDELLEILNNAMLSKNKSLCLIFGGETTVTVRGNGKGGRNQELILSASLKLRELSKAETPTGNLYFLSGGTDGIDGPTDAAGAVTYYTKSANYSVRLQTSEAAEQGLEPSDFLDSNNSYEYFRQLSNGFYHFKIGHTGTNVMDLIILYVSMDT